MITLLPIRPLLEIEASSASREDKPWRNCLDNGLTNRETEALMANDDWHNPPESEIAALLRQSHTIAVVGCSPKPDRTSHQITRFLIEAGYRVFPVHPQAKEILGQTVYPSLAAIPEPVDIVDVFRKPEFTPPIAEAAVAIGAKALWLQQGIINADSYRIATAGGLTCIMDRCIAVMHRMLLR